VTWLRAVLEDRRRRQQGSVLSGVLIMTAFIAIISGALMTMLSTNFLLSRNLTNRINTQATVNSAVEMTIDRMQSTPLIGGCPTPATVSLNGLTATARYLECFPVVDGRSPQFNTVVAGSSAFTTDGSFDDIPRAGQRLYTVGNVGGRVYQFGFGNRNPYWAYSLPGSVSGAPLAMPDLGGSSNRLITLVPLSVSLNPPSQCQSGGCVALLGQDAGLPPDQQCYMAANGPVDSQPAEGVNIPTVAYFGDHTGAVFAYAATGSGNCAAQLPALTLSSGQPVVAGPIVFAGKVTATTRTDELYFLTADTSSSHLIEVSFTTRSGQPPTLIGGASLSLPASRAIGLDVDGTTAPARIAITYAGGHVSMVQVLGDFSMQLTADVSIGTGIGADPYWCHCPGPSDQIGVGALNGRLYVLDPSLNVLATLASGGYALTTPAADGVGDWFVGDANGDVREALMMPGSPTMVEVRKYLTPADVTGSPVQAAACSIGICLYFASLDGNVFRVALDARNAVVSACITTSPPACSGSNPRVLAELEIGVAGNVRAVHVQGWSYYSP
jgi:hypothetical protein